MLLLRFPTAHSTAGRGTSPLSADQVVVFDAPGASTTVFAICDPFCGTFVSGINDSGAIAGYYNDSNVVVHGYVRSISGSFQSFDVSGAGNQPGQYQGTEPLAINNSGTIAGVIVTSTDALRAFIRSQNGDVTVFDVTGAGTGAMQGSVANCINQLGEIAGYYTDSSNVTHGFVRMPDGIVTTFDAAAGALATFPAGPQCLTMSGEVAGGYTDASGNFHGFLRSVNGTISTADPPNSTEVFLNAINDAGVAVGGFLDNSGQPPPAGFHGFIRKQNGTYVQLDAFGQPGTTAHSINLTGTVAGEYTQIPFVLSKQGVYSSYTVTGSAGAFPLQINFSNVIAGIGHDGVAHGYIAFPSR